MLTFADMKLTAKLELDKTSIYTEVNKHTDYKGAKADATLYDKVRVKSGDKTMLERWWSDGCSLATTILIPYVSGIDNNIKYKVDGVETTKDGFTITLSMPSNWNVSVKGKMQDALTALVTDYLLHQWYLLLDIEGQAKTAQENQQTSIALVGQMLYARVRPTRPTFAEDIYGN